MIEGRGIFSIDLVQLQGWEWEGAHSLGLLARAGKTDQRDRVAKGIASWGRYSATQSVIPGLVPAPNFLLPVFTKTRPEINKYLETFIAI